jgi:hypothetical protein
MELEQKYKGWTISVDVTGKFTAQLGASGSILTSVSLGGLRSKINHTISRTVCTQPIEAVRVTTEFRDVGDNIPEEEHIVVRYVTIVGLRNNRHLTVRTPEGLEEEITLDYSEKVYHNRLDIREILTEYVQLHRQRDILDDQISRIDDRLNNEFEIDMETISQPATRSITDFPEEE